MNDFQESHRHGMYHLPNRVNKMPLNVCIDNNLSLALDEKIPLKTRNIKVSNKELWLNYLQTL